MRPNPDREAELEAQEENRLDRALAERGRQDELGKLPELLLRELKPFSDAELIAASLPHPHVFSDGEHGFFPVREVTVLASPPRVGKTSAEVGIAIRMALGLALGALPIAFRPSVLIYSAEDDRISYARKTLAHMLDCEQREIVRARIIVPDLNVPGVAQARQIVTSLNREPQASAMTEALIEAVMAMEDCPGLIVFETASTLSDADEDNRGHRTMIAALKRIAVETNSAVLLVHHTSQAANSKLPGLQVSTDDVRGATPLVANARQILMLVDLGSGEDPHPDNDLRTTLRAMLNVGPQDRVTALICLDSSKSKAPSPLFFRWEFTPVGPRCVELDPPPCFRGKPWRNVRQQVIAHHAKRRENAAEEKDTATRLKVLGAVRALCAGGAQPTVSKVKAVVGNRAHNTIRDVLDSCVAERLLLVTQEKVPRTKGESAVYRPAAEVTSPADEREFSEHEARDEPSGMVFYSERDIR